MNTCPKCGSTDISLQNNSKKPSLPKNRYMKTIGLWSLVIMVTFIAQRYISLFAPSLKTVVTIIGLVVGGIVISKINIKYMKSENAISKCNVCNNIFTAIS